MVDFCHLHNHDEYSALDGFGTAKQYCEQAEKIGYEYLGSTNHANIDGLIKFQKECRERDIIPVLGCEGYIVPDPSKKNKGDRRGHICFWVKNQIGFKNLCKLLTHANMEGFYYRPRMGFEEVLDLCEGLVISTACSQSFLNLEGGNDFFLDLYERIEDDLYLEVMPHDYKGQYRINKICRRLSKKYEIPLVATNDCHYVKKSQWKGHEVLLAIQRRAKWDDPNRWKFGITGLHLRTPEEMFDAFIEQGIFTKREIRKAMEFSLEIAEKCEDYTIPKLDIKLPRISEAEGRIESRMLRQICESNFENMFGEDMQNYKDERYWKRYREEFRIIRHKKFVRYFLIVWELVNWCKINDVMVGPGRGSVGGSLIAYLMGITTVDPLKFGLLFSRFISEDRIDYPDIDLDFEDSKRHLVREHIEDLYGEKKVAGISTFMRMKSRAIIKDVGRVFDVPDKEANELTKLIDPSEENAIQDAMRETEEGRAFKKKYPLVVKYALQLEGQIKGGGQHAAGVIVSDDEIENAGRGNIAIRNNVPVINWEMSDTEYIGLMKLDILGLNTLSVLNEARRLIKENHEKDIFFPSISLKDKRIFKEIRNGNVVGVFQLGTWAMTRLIEELQPTCFEDIVASVALVRPGPNDSGMTADYIKRKNGSKWHHLHPAYEEITKETYGIIVYQEQVMRVISEVAGLPITTADKIRKIIGKKRDVKEFAPFKKMFIEGCLNEKTLSKTEAENFWEALQNHARYSFNKSHSVEYAMISYWCMWVKTYYPTEFICAVLTYGADSKKEEIVEEAYRLGLNLILPKVNSETHPVRWKAKGRKLYIPFVEVKGIGEKTCWQINTGKRNGMLQFFNKKQSANNTEQHKGSLGKVLKAIGAYGNKPEDDISKYFDFRTEANPRKQYPNLYRLFRGNLAIEDLDDALLARKVKKNFIFKSEEKSRGYVQCSKCGLRKNGTPSPMIAGRYNIMIVELYKPESKKNVKKNIKILEDEFSKVDLKIEDFYRTHLIKCPIEKSEEKYVEKCSHLLLEEIRDIRPKVILSFGKITMKYFLGRDDSITKLSGKTEWSEDFNAWIVPCVAPSAVIQNKENKIHFKNGIRNFARTLRIIGSKYF